MPLNLSEKDRKNLTIGGFVAFLVVAATILSYMYLFANNWKTLKEEIDKENQMLEESKKITEEKEKLLAHIDKTEKDIEKYERMLPEDKQVPSLLSELYRIAEESNLQFLTLEALPIKEEKSYIEIPLKIRLKCDYHGLGKFLNRVEHSQRFAKVDNITIKYDPKDPLHHDIELILSTFMFVKKEAPAPTKTGG